MKLDDILATAGDYPLSGFDWGASVVILVNSLVPAECHIDVSHTGKEARSKLRNAPTSTLLTILVREVRLNGASVEFVPTAIEQTSGIPPTVPMAGSRKMNPAAVAVLVFLSLIGMAFTWSSITATHNAGEPVEHDTLKIIIQTMTELVKDGQ